MTLGEMAKYFGIDKSNVRKYLKKKGFNFTVVRQKERGNQKELALSTGDYKKAADLRMKDGFTMSAFTEHK